jgi:hypothetical protein
MSGLTNPVLAILKLFNAFAFIHRSPQCFNQKNNSQGIILAFSVRFYSALWFNF